MYWEPNPRSRPLSKRGASVFWCFISMSNMPLQSLCEITKTPRYSAKACSALPALAGEPCIQMHMNVLFHVQSLYYISNRTSFPWKVWNTTLFLFSLTWQKQLSVFQTIVSNLGLLIMICCGEIHLQPIFMLLSTGEVQFTHFLSMHSSFSANSIKTQLQASKQSYRQHTPA